MPNCSHSANLCASQKFAHRVTTALMPAFTVRSMRKKPTPPEKDEEKTWYAAEWIELKGLKQKDIVERTKYNKGLVSEYVSGSRRWNMDVLQAFASAIGVDRADLLRPPIDPENELAKYLMGLDERQRSQALKIIKAIVEDKSAA